MNNLTNPIRTIHEVKSFLNYLYNTLNLNYHPNDSIADYLPEDTSYDIIRNLENRINDCFEIADDLIYDISFDILYSKIKQLIQY